MRVDKRFGLIIAAICIIIILIGLRFLLVPKTAVFSDNPIDWLNEEDEVISVDIREATRALSYIDSLGQQYESLEVRTVFSHDGVYKGKYFTNEYIDEKGNVKIRFTEDLNPENSIPEGYLIETFENDKPVVYIFLDEDWKKEMPNTNVIWGRTYQNFEKFNFEEIKNGIYFMRIEDDEERFSEDYSLHYGGVIIGDLGKNNLDARNFQSSTFLRLK